LILDYPPGVPRNFKGDAGRIRQVITNLTGNAVKFTPAGQVLIAVRCEKQDTESAKMRISVTDTGIGIPEEKIGSLFEKFSQVDASTTRKYGGTGLGLAISKQLIGLMDGSIHVESQLGRGSTFWFTLPLALDAQPTSAPVDGLMGARAMIVDGNELTRLSIQDQICGLGMRAEGLASGDEALRAIRSAAAAGDAYKCVIAAYQLPGRNGAMLAAAIKADPALKGTAVILVTSIGNWSEVRGLEGASVDACLVKPVRHAQLVKALTANGARRENGSTGRSESTGRNSIAALHSGVAGRLLELPLRVLVAEDNIVNQTVATRMLQRMGVSADVASNGREAVEKTRAVAYDVIFMDCQMPEMNGYEATAEIRRQEGPNRHVRIIAMTADAIAGSREQCLNAGMDEYLTKPVKFEELMDTVLRNSPAHR